MNQEVEQHNQKNDIADLIPYVSVRVPSADDITIEYALRQATLAFMKDSYLFKGHTFIYGQKGVKDYILEIPEDQVVYDISEHGITLNERPIVFTRDGDYDVVRLHHPIDGACYSVEYTYHIPLTACEIPTEIENKYLDAVVSKSIMLLFTGAKDSFVSAQLFQIAQAEYQQAIETISQRRLHNFSQGRPRMKAPRRNRGGYQW